MCSAYSKFFAVVGFTTIILVGVFGMGMGDMSMNEKGEMDGCLFTGKVMLCNMSVVEHISLWQSMLTATPTKTVIPALLFFLAVFAAAFFVGRKNLLSPSLIERFVLNQQQHRQPHNIFFDHIRYTLAKGILHPRIYESAHI